MPSIDPQLAREFAVEAVRQLRAAGHQALWAGGCVRDQLMGLAPKDYDVATDAPPDRVREVFGQRRTLAVGAAFGVITVLGPKGAGQIEVATFRKDAAYSDGRHPDSVTYSDAEHDAQRRDFTINGLFFDPLAGQVIDYVGGQQDLAQRVIRAIGDPLARIAEDKLRMLRAVRFAARFDFALDERTLAAIRQQASELVIVSAERIAAELRLILTHANRSRGVQLLADSDLLDVVLPEGRFLRTDPAAWRSMLEILAALRAPTSAMAFAALLRPLHIADAALELPRRVFERWKLSTDELAGIEKLLAEEPLIRAASQQPWPQLQRVLVAPRVEELLGYCTAVARVLDGSTAEIDFCRLKLAQPPEVLSPPPLITGDDLKRLGLTPGPTFRTLLEAVRDAQLEGRIKTMDEAIALVRRLP
ncbi:MAG TPA: CCA tRNA nucleotidyltransferase [Pirellulaceae bacterium]|nr:CCA tRNA nucleotidyltransferase [Pirellulaceae bacterium]